MEAGWVNTFQLFDLLYLARKGVANFTPEPAKVKSQKTQGMQKSAGNQHGEFFPTAGNFFITNQAGPLAASGLGQLPRG
jgi:hypothetical protein